MILRGDLHMDEFVKLLDPALNYVGHRVEEQKCVIMVESNRKEVTCPYCGVIASRIHSGYIKEFHDLPIQDIQVAILINNRKFFCMNPECSHKTFSERFGFIAYKSRKTERLIKAILTLSSRVSSVAASTMLTTNTTPVSKSTICRMLKKKTPTCR